LVDERFDFRCCERVKVSAVSLCVSESLAREEIVRFQVLRVVNGQKFSKQEVSRLTIDWKTE
jgi:hypothetical protein